jgi:predicted Rossmann-fold nucleotide-binding protein
VALFKRNNNVAKPPSPRHCWKQIINFDKMVKYGVISKADLDLIQFCDTVDEAFEYLKGELTKLYLEEC